MYPQGSQRSSPGCVKFRTSFNTVIWHSGQIRFASAVSVSRHIHYNTIPYYVMSLEEKAVRQQGERKPDEVSWPEWIGPKKLTHRHQFIAHLAALGLNNRTIHEKTGMSEGRISIIVNTDLVKTEIAKIQKEHFEKDPLAKMSKLSEKAVSIIEQTLEHGGSEKLRTETAFRTLDRNHGKPTQQVEVKGNLVHELITKLDATPISVENQPEVPEKERKINDWVKENLDKI